jgi:endo-1,4-beta-xylanase
MPLLRPVLAAFILLLACAGAAGAAELEPIILWPQGAPGVQAPAAAEKLRLTAQGEHIVSGVAAPSLTAYLPDPGKATGAAVVVVPGGGHRELWMDHEGWRVGRWLADHGVAAFVLKYRLAREEGSTFTVEGDELADLQRAIRLVRSRAVDWRLAPDRIGVIGFSAGGELAALAGSRFDAGRPDADEAVERAGSRPDFMALIYPAIPHDMALGRETPPVFLLCGDNDSLAPGVAAFYGALKQAGVPAELHIIAGAAHGFGIRAENPPQVSDWPELFRLWLAGRGYLAPR